MFWNLWIFLHLAQKSGYTLRTSKFSPLEFDDLEKTRSPLDEEKKIPGNLNTIFFGQWYLNIAEWYLPSLKLTYFLKIGYPKRRLVFQASIFRCELLVSGRVFSKSTVYIQQWGWKYCFWSRCHRGDLRSARYQVGVLQVNHFSGVHHFNVVVIGVDVESVVWSFPFYCYSQWYSCCCRRSLFLSGFIMKVFMMLKCQCGLLKWLGMRIIIMRILCFFHQGLKQEAFQHAPPDPDMNLADLWRDVEHLSERLDIYI